MGLLCLDRRSLSPDTVRALANLEDTRDATVLLRGLFYYGRDKNAGIKFAVRFKVGMGIM